VSRRRAEWQACAECGEQVYRRRRYGRPVWCYRCAAEVAADAARQMSDKSGPVWDAWCASNADGAPRRSTEQPEE
jgi:hypothetical protein